MAFDVLNPFELKDVIKELDSDENKERKIRSYVAYDIYNNNQHEYVMNCLKKDYPKETVPQMRTVTSINFAQRIVDSEASIYKYEPTRVFNDASDQGQELLENIYAFSNVNYHNKLANRFYRLDEQCALMMVPNNVTGCIGLRQLQNWQYDVIPHANWYQYPFAYIIPVGVKPGGMADTGYYANVGDSDRMNQIIADKDDSALSDRRFIIWTDKYNFMCNGLGEPVGIVNDTDIENPIGRLPIIDISKPKGRSFFRDNDNSLARFTIDYLLSLTDLSEIIRMQGYSQAVLSALEVPKQMYIGPQRVLFLEKKKKMTAEEKPEFQFVSPNPDLQGTLDANLALLRMFLSSRGHKTNIITASDTIESFTSGIHKLLAMVEQHEASIDDFSLFKNVEQEQFDIMRRYSNYLQEANIEGFTLKDELRGPIISEDAYMEIKFHEPQMIETEKERQERLNQRLENGTISKLRYIMEMDGLSEEDAKAEMLSIDQEDNLVG